MAGCCPVCYKMGGVEGPTGSRGSQEDLLKEVGTVQQRFFQLFRRYLDGGDGGEEGEGKQFPFPLKEFTEIGLIACGECSKMMESFGELYHQLKTIELRLNWKVQTVKNIMKGAQRVPSRVKYFRNCVKSLLKEDGRGRWERPEEMIDAVNKSRKSLISKCSRKLRGALPNLCIEKWKSIGDKSLVDSVTNEGNQEDSNFRNNNDDGRDPEGDLDREKPDLDSDQVNFSPSESIQRPSTLEASLSCATKSTSVNIPEDCDARGNRLVERRKRKATVDGSDMSTKCSEMSMRKRTRVGRSPVKEPESGKDLENNCNNLFTPSSPLDPSDNATVEISETKIIPHLLSEVKKESNTTKKLEITSDVEEDQPQESNEGEEWIGNDISSSSDASDSSDSWCMSDDEEMEIGNIIKEKVNFDSDNPEDPLELGQNKNLTRNRNIKSQRKRKYGPMVPAIPPSKQTHDGHDFRLKCPDCSHIFPDDMKTLLLHRKTSDTCGAFYDPSTSIKVEVLVPKKKKRDLEESDFDTVYAIIDLPQEFYLCEICDFAVYTSEDMEAHQKLHGSFRCQFCNAEKCYAPDLVMHELHHDEKYMAIKSSKSFKQFDCPRCHGHVNTYSYVHHHLGSHLSLTLNKPFCAICKTSGLNFGKWKLLHHLKDEHDISNLWVSKNVTRCTKGSCNAYFRKSLQLERHMQLHHAKIRLQIRPTYEARKENQGEPADRCNQNELEISEVESTPRLGLRRNPHNSQKAPSSLESLADHLQQETNAENEDDGHDDVVGPEPRVAMTRDEVLSDSKVSGTVKETDSVKLNARKEKSNLHRYSSNRGRRIADKYRLKCPDCSNLFEDVGTLLIHRRDSDTCSVSYDPTKTVRVEVLELSEGDGDDVNSSGLAVVDLPQAIFICEECGLPVYSLEDLEVHKKLHGTFPCKFCSVKLTYAPNIALHERGHFKKRGKKKNKVGTVSLKCPQCDVTWSKESDEHTRLVYIRHHLKEHLSLTFKQHKCSICKTTGTTCFDLGKHMKRFHDVGDGASNSSNVKRCTVNNCQAYFLSGNALQNHLSMQHEHNMEKRHKCKDCGKSFIQLAFLRMHRVKFHVDPDKIIPCLFENCKYGFESKEELERHLIAPETHKQLKIDSVKEVQCPTCQVFVDGSDPNHIRDHMKVNHRKDVASFVCESCGKACQNGNALEVHYLSHFGPETWEYMCSVCSKKCISKQKLEEHMRIHTKEKPFVCEICGAKYAHRHNLRIHVNSKHGDVVQDIARKKEKTNYRERKDRRKPRRKNTSLTLITP